MSTRAELDDWARRLTANANAVVRDDQLEVIHRVVNQRKNAFSVMRTGGGKTLIYLMCAALMPSRHRRGRARVVVIGPLTLLGKEQAYRAAERLSEKVYWLSSENTPAEDEAAMLAIVSGDYDILYVSPERCEQLVESGSLSGAGKPDLVVVDEAHCVVDWAFRDSYVNLKRTRAVLGDGVQYLALTATAPLFVRHAICDALGIGPADMMLGSVVRDNIAIEVYPDESDAKLVELVNKTCVMQRAKEDSGVVMVFVPRHEDVARITALLQTELAKPGRGFVVMGYHSKVPKHSKLATEQAFCEHTLHVVVTTSALAMGIDNSGVRHVINWGATDTMSLYSQMQGRAGRDGKPALSTVLWDAARFGGQPMQMMLREVDTAERRAYLAHSKLLVEHFCKSSHRCLRVLLMRSLGEVLPEPSGATFANARLAGKMPCCDNCLSGRSFEDLVDVRLEWDGVRQAVGPHGLGMTRLMEALAATQPHHDVAWWRHLVLTLLAEGVLDMKCVSFSADNVPSREWPMPYFVLATRQPPIRPLPLPDFMRT